MKFNIQKSDLMKSINTVSKAVATKNTMEILKGIHFDTFEGKLILTATDMDLEIQNTLDDANIQEEGTIIIEAKLLNDMIRKLPNKTVYFETENEDTIKIKCEATEYKVKYMVSDQFPMPQYIDEQNFINIKTETLKSTIIKTAYAMSQSDAQASFSSHFMSIKDNYLEMFTIDGFRLAYMKKELEDLNYYDKQFLVQGSTMMEISRILEESSEYVKFAHDNKHICIMTGNTIITTTLVTGKFIEPENMIPKNNTVTIKVKTQQLKAALERVAVISSNKLVKLETKGNILTIESRNDSIGEGQEVVDINLEGEDIIIAFNCDYLLDAIKNIEEENIIIKGIDSVSPCIISPENDPLYVNMVLPVRIR